MSKKSKKITEQLVLELLTESGAPKQRAGIIPVSQAAELMELLRDIQINPKSELVALSKALTRGKRARDELSRVLSDVVDRMRQNPPLLAAILADAQDGASKHNEKITILLHLNDSLALAEPALRLQRLNLFDRKRVTYMVWNFYRYIVGDAGRSVSSPAVRFVAKALPLLGYGEILPASVAQALRRAKPGPTND